MVLKSQTRAGVRTTTDSVIRNRALLDKMRPHTLFVIYTVSSTISIIVSRYHAFYDERLDTTAVFARALGWV